MASIVGPIHTFSTEPPLPERVLIGAVANGFVVTHAGDVTSANPRKTFVFANLGQLGKFLARHFQQQKKLEFKIAKA